MEPTTVNSISSGQAAASTPQHRGLQDLRSEDFFQLLITELQSQDPLKPNDTSQLVQEMSTIKQMEVSGRLESTLSALAQQERIGGATGLIGRYVTGSVKSSTGQGSAVAVEGVVVAVQFNPSGDAVLELHTGDTLPMKDVRNVTLIDPGTLAPLNDLPAETAPETAETARLKWGEDPVSAWLRRLFNPPETASAALR